MIKARAVRLVAGVAELPPGMILGVDLREALRFGDIFGMAADAEMCDVGFLRRDASGIVGVFRQRTVAGFTVDVRMDAF